LLQRPSGDAWPRCLLEGMLFFFVCDWVGRVALG
jgi:hypothetical protein